MNIEQPGGLLGAAFRAGTVPSLIVDTGTRVVAANAAYADMSGRTVDELVGAFTLDFIHADDLTGALAGYDRLLSGEPSVSQRRRHLRADGVWIDVLAVTVQLEFEGAHYLLVQVLEHTAAGEPRGAEVLNEVRARTELQPFGDASCFHDGEGRMVMTPRGLATRLGRPIEWLYGRRLTDPGLGALGPAGEPLAPDDDPVLEAIRTGVDVTRTIGLTAADGSVAWYSVRAGLVEHLNTVAARSTLRDVDELIEAQQEIRALAAIVEQDLAHRLDHDDLTGLKTRRALIELTDAALWSGGPVAVVFVDLDHFKEINDELGHLPGDEVLAAAAVVLHGLAPAGTTLGRAGGDEFVLLARDHADAERFAAAVRDRTANAPGLVTVRNRPVRASVGVGVAEPGDTRSTLFARADAAMYRAKHSRRQAPQTLG